MTRSEEMVLEEMAQAQREDTIRLMEEEALEAYIAEELSTMEWEATCQYGHIDSQWI